MVSAGLAGALLGCAIHAGNAQLRPECYIASVTGQTLISVGWRSSIDAGIEGFCIGAVFGVVLGVAFTVGISIITKDRCSFGFGFRRFLLVGAGVYVGWFLGGCAALLLHVFDWEYCRETFGPYTPLIDPRALIGHAWAGGSSWGAIIGGLVSVVLVLWLLHRSRPSSPWREEPAAQ